ncbi:hypothetical protein Esti_001034 [Eimeria stiedai]
MLLVGGVTCGEKSQLTTSHWRRAASICLVDVAHQILEKAGLVHAGSALYLIAASFSTVWTALLSLLVLNKRMNQTQWVGVLLVTLGFCLRVAQVGPPAQGNDELLGVLLITTAQILHGLAFVLNEKYMNDEEAAIEGPQLVFMCGFINTVGLLCWTGVWTAPRWGALVTNARKQRGGSSAVIAGCFVGLTVCSLLRSSVLWVLLKHLGAVSAGVLKAARMAVVTALTHLLFCSQQPSQCLTPLKAVAASVTMLGVLLYSLGSHANLGNKNDDEQKVEKRKKRLSLAHQSSNLRFK